MIVRRTIHESMLKNPQSIDQRHISEKIVEVQDKVNYQIDSLAKRDNQDGDLESAKGLVRLDSAIGSGDRTSKREALLDVESGKLEQSHTYSSPWISFHDDGERRGVGVKTDSVSKSESDTQVTWSESHEVRSDAFSPDHQDKIEVQYDKANGVYTLIEETKIL